MKRGRGSGKACNLAGWIGSPPSTTLRNPPSPSAPAASIKAWKALGDRLIWVMPSRRICATSASGTNGPARCRRPPASSGPRMFFWVRSKLYEETSSTVSSLRSPKSSRYQSSRLLKPRCSTITPLGRPVEPEV
ncbi:hypothetical protein GO279_04933 [Ralstonia solanacearum]|nr:hypothetical protein [Ralstonia solanacearum]